MNVGKLAVTAGGIKTIGDGKLTHDRKEEIKVIEDGEDDEELVAMQKAVADTGLLNTLKEGKLELETAIVSQQKSEQDEFEGTGTHSAMGTTSNLLSAIHEANKDIEIKGGAD